MTIEGNNSVIYRIEARNKLDGSDWKFHTNRSECLHYLLAQYRDNEIVEYRIKSFSEWNKPVDTDFVL